MLSSALQILSESLSSNNILASDAIVSACKLLNKRIADQSNLSSQYTNYFTRTIASLNKELLGYDAPDWDLNGPYRRLEALIVRATPGSDPDEFKPLRAHEFIAVWGAQQLETFLSDVMDISVLKSGSDSSIEEEIVRLAGMNYAIYTESGISSDLWLKFNVLEMVRLYFEIQQVLIRLIRLMAQALEMEAKAHTSIQFNATPDFVDTAHNNRFVTTEFSTAQSSATIS